MVVYIVVSMSEWSDLDEFRDLHKVFTSKVQAERWSYNYMYRTGYETRVLSRTIQERK